MNKKNVTKHALFGSIISMLLCCTMFIGTTFAWFTDSVTSSNNKIESGTLDVDLQMYDEKEGKYISIADEEGAIFTENGNGINWEPGKTEVVYLKVKNNGNLNLKFDFLLTVVDGGLVETLEYVVIDGDYSAPENQFTSWEQVETKWIEQQNESSAALVIPRLYEGVITANQGQLMPKDSDDNNDEKTFALAIHMKEGVGNEFQGTSVTIDASVFATQASVEEDSFGENYDAGATYNYVTYEDGMDFMELWETTPEGSTIYLSRNVDVARLFVDKSMTIDAAGHGFNITSAVSTISASNEVTSGLKFEEGKSLTIRNAKMSTLPVTGVGTLVLSGTTITATEAGVSALVLNNATLNLVVKGYTVLTGATNGSGINVDKDSTLDLSGTGKLVTVGNAGKESPYATPQHDGGSGIGGNGTINIHDMANLTAEGYGEHGFGIGGNGANVSIEKTIIAYAKGGYVQPNLINDIEYGKSEPEGGSAIGGAKITLTGVTIEKAEGGSKAAGIGAQFHQAVEISISNSTIKEVIGGNASAGIGGSRIKDDNQKEQTVTIVIDNSTINAFGGEFGAGIGSGYDTHCSDPEFEESPICTINITGDSKITAVGGKRAAGIGTGYHAGGLAGAIEARNGDKGPIIDAKAGVSDKPDYSTAQDVGFGVVDPNREGKTSVNCEFNNQGTVVEVVFPQTAN